MQSCRFGCSKEIHVKRVAVVFASAGLVATTLGVGALTQSAFAVDSFTPAMSAAGAKKVAVDWAHSPVLAADAASAPFDALFVTLDNDLGATPTTADRVHIVDSSATSTQFDDINSSTTYYASVFAIDYDATGFTIVPPTGGAADTPLGTVTGDYSPLTIASSSSLVLSGKTVTLSGRVKTSDDPLSKVIVSRDPYPQFGGAEQEPVVPDANGNWTFTSPELTENTWFWAEYDDADGVGGWTSRINVDVRKKMSLSVSPGLTVDAGTSVTFSGDTKGDPTFLDDATVKVCLQHLEGGSWAKKFCKPVEADGHYTLTFKPGANADGKYRAWSGMGPAYANSWSATRKLVVR
jgi:hypothetical protein